MIWRGYLIPWLYPTLTVSSNAVYGKKRGPKVGTGRGQKRKAENEYSENPHTKKARNRKEKMTQAQKDLEAAKSRERQALSRKIKALQKNEKYLAMPLDLQKLYVDEITAGTRQIQYRLAFPILVSTNTH
jgi:hypothetical protein